jgi:ABC-type lipoprotein export system ATPase subunit
MLKVKNITKTYESKKLEFTALHDVSFELPDKGFYAILGPSGCGKTTLLNIIGGMDSDFKGSVQVDNKSIDSLSQNKLDDYRKDTIGFIFQHAVLLNSLTVYENIIFPLQIDSQPSQVQINRANEILRLLNIHDLRNRKVNTLSGGQKQRVVIARALINDPKVILADEPTGELDTKNSRIILDILQKLSSERLIIMVTHEEKFAYDYATKIIKMKDGIIEEIIDNSNNVTNSNLVFNLTKKVKTGKKPRLPLKTNLKIAVRSLGLHKVRNLLSCIGLSIGLTGIALAIMLTNGFQSFLKDTLLNLENENYAHVVKENKNRYLDLTEDDYKKILENDNDVNLIKYTNYLAPYLNHYIPLETENGVQVSYLYNVFNYQYIEYKDSSIMPSLGEPLKANEVLVNANRYKDYCDLLSLNTSTCTQEQVAVKLNTIQPKIKFDNNTFIEYLKEVEFKVVGLVRTSNADYNSQDGIYHTSVDFAKTFVDNGPFVEGDGFDFTVYPLYVLTYKENKNINDVIKSLNNDEALADYTFVAINPYSKNINVYRTDYVKLTTTDIEKFINENKQTTVGFAYGDYFTIYNNQFRFNQNIFLSDSKQLTDDFANNENYLNLPLDDLPYNLFNSRVGNTFAFRPLFANAIDSIQYYNITGSVPTNNSTTDIVISKGLADSLLTGKTKDYSTLINKTLYGSINFDGHILDNFTLKIVGVALNEKKPMIMAHGNWTINFFNEVLSEEHKVDYSASSKSIYLFSKKSVDIVDYIETLREKYPDYSINNDIADLNASVKEVLHGVRTVLIVLSSISIIVAVMLISMVSFISIIERKQEVGVMRTMGARKGDILLLFLNETMFLGVISSLISYLGSWLFSTLINFIFNLAITITLLGSTSNFKIIKFDLQALVTVFICAIILTIIASIVPALKISKVDPINALKKK